METAVGRSPEHSCSLTAIHIPVSSDVPAYVRSLANLKNLQWIVVELGNIQVPASFLQSVNSSARLQELVIYASN